MVFWVNISVLLCIKKFSFPMEENFQQHLQKVLMEKEAFSIGILSHE